MKNHFLLLIVFFALIVTSCTGNKEIIEKKKISELHSTHYLSSGAIYSTNTYKYYYNSSNFINKIHIKRVYETRPEISHEYIINRNFDGDKIVSENYDYVLKRKKGTNILNIEYTYTDDLISKQVALLDNDLLETFEYSYNTDGYLTQRKRVETNYTDSYFYNAQNLLEKQYNDVNPGHIINYMYEEVLNPFYKFSPLALQRNSHIQKEIAFHNDFTIEATKNEEGYPINIKRHRKDYLWSDTNYTYQ